MFCKLNIKDDNAFCTDISTITTIKIFTCSYIKKSLKKCLHLFNKLLATTKQLIRRNSICCLKNQAIFFRVSIEIDPSPPSVCFQSLFKDPPPLPLYNKTFIKKGSLEEMEGVNDNASAFMHLNIKTNK